MSIQIQIGLDAISSYRRLSYTAWYAIAEFVDNSTQSYFNNREILDKAYEKKSEKLKVSVVYDGGKGGVLRIVDNAMGMSYEELEHALRIGLPPENTSGRSKYGMGLKTAASWIGDEWLVRTKKLGEAYEHEVIVDVGKVTAGCAELPYVKRPQDTQLHYTIIEIRKHNRRFQGRTLSKIKDYLRSMYRCDLEEGLLELEWQNEKLSWEGFEMLLDWEGREYKKSFEFKINGKAASGWVGILAKGTRANAGFSIIHCGRVVKGWPEAWRPSKLYGQIQGSNDLVNQRLVGEIHLDDFEVSHTKDNILFLGDEEDRVEDELLKKCVDYREVAVKHRKSDDDERGPSQTEVDVAVDEFLQELSSDELADLVNLEQPVPPEDAVREMLRDVASKASKGIATFEAGIGQLVVRGYIEALSVNDPYVVIDSAPDQDVVVVINQAHPHWVQIKGSDGVLNYLRHCTYDALAEWQARKKAGRLDPETVKLYKDRLLRVHLQLEMNPPALL